MSFGQQFGQMPDTLGPYRLIRLLGHGGMSQVFLARRYGASGFEKQVALKTLPVEQFGNETLTRSLIEEAKICAGLNHRNLAQIYDLGVDEGIYYLCMEYIEGINLKSILTQQRPAVEVALFIAQEVALALDYIHSATDSEGRPLGLIHRDVSPSNILISRSGEVKLTDFGIAKATLLSDVTWGRFRKGTVAYMSPEQVRGETLSSQSDQFGLGIVLTEMLTGSRPFDGHGPAETLDRIRVAAPLDLQAAPTSLRPLLQKILSLDPQQRFSTSRSLYESIDNSKQAYPPANPFTLQRLAQQINP